MSHELAALLAFIILLPVAAVLWSRFRPSRPAKPRPPVFMEVSIEGGSVKFTEPEAILSGPLGKMPVQTARAFVTWWEAGIAIAIGCVFAALLYGGGIVLDAKQAAQDAKKAADDAEEVSADAKEISLENRYGWGRLSLELLVSNAVQMCGIADAVNEAGIGLDVPPCPPDIAAEQKQLLDQLRAEMQVRDQAADGGAEGDP